MTFSFSLKFTIVCDYEQVETWLLNSRVGYNSAVDHRSDQSLLHCAVMSTGVVSAIY